MFPLGLVLPQLPPCLVTVAMEVRKPVRPVEKKPSCQPIAQSQPWPRMRRAVFQLRAAALSGRWEEISTPTREAVERDRRKDWCWLLPECLADLITTEEDEEDLPQTSTGKQSKRSAA